MASQRVLGVDIGSSSIKGAVLDLEKGTVSGVTREPFPEPVPGMPSGFHEVDPLEVVHRTEAVLQRLATATPDADSVYFCGQMGGILLVDQRYRPLTNYLSWRDQRTTQPPLSGGSSVLDQLRTRWTDAMFSDIGSELKPGSATSLLFWLALHSRLPSEAMPVTIGDFVVSHFCRAVPKMERTQTIGMLNLRTGHFYRDAFDCIDLGELNWPDLTNCDQPVGQMAVNGRSITVYPVVGDQQAALRGIDLRPDELSINISTGSQVSQITPVFQPAGCQSRSWFHGQFLNTVTHIPAGRSLTVLESLLTELARLAGVQIHDSWKLIAREASRADGAGLRCDLSFFASAMGADGRIEGITTENLTIGNLFQAAFDFMVNSYYECASRLSTNPAWKRLAVSGGLIQAFSALRQKLEHRFALPMREVAEQEETLLGLLKLARAR